MYIDPVQFGWISVKEVPATNWLKYIFTE